MSSHNVAPGSTKPPKKVLMVQGSRVWYTFKFVECVLAVSCLLVLILTQYLSVVVDDFSAVKAKTGTTNRTLMTNITYKSKIESRQANEIPQVVLISNELTETSTNRVRLRDDHLESKVINWDAHIRINKRLKRVKKISNVKELGSEGKHEDCSVSLNDLLFMYPCCTTLLMVIAMEVFGEVFKDPLSKLTILILVSLAILLTIVLFVMGVLAHLRCPNVTFILTTTLSAFLMVVEIINFILLLLS